MLKLIANNDEKLRNQVHIQDPCRILDEALYNFLPLPIFGKSFILNVVEFLDLSLKISPGTETSLFLWENQSFFLLFRNVVAFIKSLYYFLAYDELLLCSLLDVYYHYLGFENQCTQILNLSSPALK